MNLKYAAADTLIAAAVSLSACGGDDGSDADPKEAAAEKLSLVANVKQTSDRVSRASVDRDAAALCREFRPTQVEDQFGSLKACAKVVRRSFQGEPATKPFRVENISQVDGGLLVTYKDNPPGEIVFANEDGRLYIDLEGAPQPGQP